MAADTANSYLSHVIKRAMERRILPNSETIRTDYVGGVLEGLRKTSASSTPQRQRVRIPMTYPLLLTAVAITEKLRFVQPAAHAAITAALALGYGCSLRPGEYLVTGSQRGKSKMVSASKVFLWWDRRPFALSDAANFPKGPADRVTVTLDSTKNDPYGKGMPRGV